MENKSLLFSIDINYYILLSSAGFFLYVNYNIMIQQYLSTTFDGFPIDNLVIDSLQQVHTPHLNSLTLPSKYPFIPRTIVP